MGAKSKLSYYMEKVSGGDAGARSGRRNLGSEGSKQLWKELH